MSDAVVLTLREEPKHALIADAIAPDRFAALGAAEIAALPVVHGGRVARLGDFFKVKGERLANVRVEGDLARVEGIGSAMAGGQLWINGNVGRDLGIGMRGGMIEVRGNAGDNAAGALPGASRGMTGGEVIIWGSTGAEVGARMRRGLVVVGVDAGRGAARGMIAGTVVVFGNAAAGAGRFLKRGTIVAFGAPALPATFRYACTYQPPHVRLLLIYLKGRHGVPVKDEHITGRYERYAGDMAELGKGEILRWVGGPGARGGGT